MEIKLGRRILQAKKQLITLLSMFSLYWISPQVAHAIPFSEISQVYFFGDSLTDSGFNNNYLVVTGGPSGKAPTYTTYGGYTWAQYVARDIKGFTLLPSGTVFPTTADTITNNLTPTIPDPVPFVIPELTGINFACGGSRVDTNPGVDFTWAPSLHQQIEYYLSTAPQTLDPNALYFIWSGANDMLYGITSQLSVPDFIQLIDQTTTQIVNEVKTLSARGAKRIVVLSLPNIGITPLISGLAVETGNPQLPGEIKNLSFIFDSLLNQKLGVVVNKNKVKILYFDTYKALDNLVINAEAGLPTVVNGQAFYFDNYTDPVCGLGVSAIACTQTSNNYLFADSVHPTDSAHRALSLEVENQINQWA